MSFLSDQGFLIPDILELRDRIEMIKPKSIKMCAKYIYCICGRASEAVGLSAPSDVGTTPRGPISRSLSFQEHEGEEVAVFSVRTAKRDGHRRTCAVPLAREYEPWAKEVADYFSEFDPRELVFPFTRQKLSRLSKKVWKDLWYDIRPYNVVDLDINGNPIMKEDGKKQTTKIELHRRTMTIHAIRHFRASDLSEYYGFSGKDLSAFGGWTLGSGMQMSTSIESYIQLNWREYYPKLRKKRY